MTNSFFGDKVFLMSFTWITAIKKDKRVRVQRPDVLTEQVKLLLQKADQKLILMVRG